MNAEDAGLSGSHVLVVQAKLLILPALLSKSSSRNGSRSRTKRSNNLKGTSCDARRTSYRPIFWAFLGDMSGFPRKVATAWVGVGAHPPAALGRQDGCMLPNLGATVYPMLLILLHGSSMADRGSSIHGSDSNCDEASPSDGMH